MLPNFLIAGAAKAGSTTLYRLLDEHPDVYMCPEKEPAYFTKHWTGRDLDWYKGLFLAWNGQAAVGEATVEYMVDPMAAQRIHETIPDVRLIFILRDPVERAWSHYWHRVKMGQEPREFVDVIDDEGDNAYPIRYGMYARQIDTYLDWFPEEQLMVVILEEMREHYALNVRRILRHIAVSDERVSPSLRVENQSAIPRSEVLGRLSALVRRSDRVKSALPGRFATPLRRGFRWVNRRNMRSWEYPPPPQAVVERLEATFAGTIAGVESFLNREVTLWSRPDARRSRNVSGREGRGDPP